jgi:hypothetical protein
MKRTIPGTVLEHSKNSLATVITLYRTHVLLLLLPMTVLTARRCTLVNIDNTRTLQVTHFTLHVT